MPYDQLIALYASLIGVLSGGISG